MARSYCHVNVHIVAAICTLQTGQHEPGNDKCSPVWALQLLHVGWMLQPTGIYIHVQCMSDPYST